MKKKRRFDDDMPIGPVRIVPDFLPPPEELAIPFKKKKVTLLLDQWSVDFFKTRAQRHGTKYQQMMREVLRRYAMHLASSHKAA